MYDVTFSLKSFWAFLMSVYGAFVEDRPLHHHDVRQVILRQIFFTGLQAFRLVGMGALIIGTVTVAQSSTQLSRLGGSEALGPILVGAFIRELGPLVTVVVVVARSVSAIASELSSMKANGEIEGLRAVGVSPLSYLVVPRVLSGAISTLLLAIHFVWISFGVGFVVAQFFVNMPFDRFFENVITNVSILDITIFVVKTFSLGSLVFLLACYCGLRTSGTSFEIPQATTKAVVWSFMLSFGAQIVISGVYYLWLLQRAGLGGLL
jgi:phospholipid/cholesterol/gamma-HCH transport system permease protein